jgi:hypothetical protein
VRHDRIDKTGRVTLRHRSRSHHIAVGRAHAGIRVLLLVADLDVRVLTLDGEGPPPVDARSEPELPAAGRDVVSGMSRDICLRCLATSQKWAVEDSNL